MPTTPASATPLLERPLVWWATLTTPCKIPIIPQSIMHLSEELCTDSINVRNTVMYQGWKCSPRLLLLLKSSSLELSADHKPHCRRDLNKNIFPGGQVPMRVLVPTLLCLLISNNLIYWQETKFSMLFKFHSIQLTCKQKLWYRVTHLWSRYVKVALLTEVLEWKFITLKHSRKQNGKFSWDLVNIIRRQWFAGYFTLTVCCRISRLFDDAKKMLLYSQSDKSYEGYKGLVRALRKLQSNTAGTSDNLTAPKHHVSCVLQWILSGIQFISKMKNVTVQHVMLHRAL